MIDFQDAINIAEKNLVKLIKGANNLVLEGVLISKDDKNYEVSISYDVEGGNDLNLKGVDSNMFSLLALMKKRREYKVFLIEKSSGAFRGFKSYKED